MVFKQPILQKLDNKRAGFLVKLALLMFKGVFYLAYQLCVETYLEFPFSFRRWSMFEGRHLEEYSRGFR